MLRPREYVMCVTLIFISGLKKASLPQAQNKLSL